MRVAVMQPTYLSWLGYLDLLDRVDHFVLLDDVAFSRGSWQQRVRIKATTGPQWLSVPVARPRTGRIDAIRIGDADFWHRHLRSIEQSHARAAHADAALDGLRRLYASGAPWERLADLNAALLAFLAGRFGIETPVVRSSQLDVPGRRGEKVAALCEKLGASEYVSPPGAVGYLHEDAPAFAARGIAVSIAGFEHPRHRQLHGPFVPGLSSLDLLANEGPEALSILRGGRREALALERFAPDGALLP